MIYTRKLLEQDQIDFIIEQLPKIKWIDGRRSGGGERKVNVQTDSSCPVAKQVDDMLFECLDKDMKFTRMVIPKFTNRIMLSKTPTGGHYHPHLDVAELGEYSTTIFLNDDYEGGELELLDGADKVSVKLPPGHAVSYKTGTPHTVNRVTSGERIVGVTWTTSVYRDEIHRNICSDIYRMLDNLPDDMKNHDMIEDLEEWHNHPVEIGRALLHKIKRAYGRL